MKIISISLDQETLTDLDKAQETMGFKSRSRLLRATLQSLLNEYKILDSVKGHVDSVFVMTYKESDKSRISDIIHRFDDSVKTIVHQHHVGICLEVLIVCAEAKRIREFFSMLKRDKGVRSLNCSLL